jgi:hypothetical protein
LTHDNPVEHLAIPAYTGFFNEIPANDDDVVSIGNLNDMAAFIKTFEKLNDLYSAAPSVSKPTVWLVSRSISSRTCHSCGFGWSGLLHRFETWEPQLHLVYQLWRNWLAALGSEPDLPAGSLGAIPYTHDSLYTVKLHFSSVSILSYIQQVTF